MWVYVIGHKGPEILRGGGGINPTGGKWFGRIWTLPLPRPPKRLMLQGDQVNTSVSLREVVRSGIGSLKSGRGDHVSGEVMPHRGSGC